MLFGLSEGTIGLFCPKRRFSEAEWLLGRAPGALIFYLSKNKKRKDKFTKIPGLLGDTDSRIFGVSRSAAAAP